MAGLVLRRYRDTDLDLVYDLEADPSVMRYINGGLPVTRHEVLAARVPLFTAVTNPVLGFWMIDIDGCTEGWISLRSRQPGTAELGYRLRPAAWGRGIATRAGRQLLQRAFTETDVGRVYATTYEDNAASIRVMERLGMQFERLLTDDEVAAGSDTSEQGDDVWPGSDVRYEVSREAFMAARPAGNPGAP